MFRKSLLAATLVIGTMASSDFTAPAEAAMQCNAGFVKSGGNSNSINCIHVQNYPSQYAAIAGNTLWKSKVGCNTGMYGPATLQVAKTGPSWIGVVKFVCLGIT